MHFFLAVPILLSIIAGVDRTIPRAFTRELVAWSSTDEPWGIPCGRYLFLTSSGKVVYKGITRSGLNNLESTQIDSVFLQSIAEIRLLPVDSEPRLDFKLAVGHKRTTVTLAISRRDRDQASCLFTPGRVEAE